MQCTCKSDTEAKLLERFRIEKPDGQNHAASLHGYGFLIDKDRMVMRPYAEVTMVADFPKKSGGFSTKRSRLNMYFSYCPFCGKPVTEDQAGADTKTGGAA